MKTPPPAKLRTITVYYCCGDKVTTDINGTDAEILAYYVGKEFNLGDGAGGDRMSTAVFVMFHDKSIDENRLDVLNAIKKIMVDYDTSEDKKHPWIPGMACRALKPLIDDVL